MGYDEHYCLSENICHACEEENEKTKEEKEEEWEKIKRDKISTIVLENEKTKKKY